MAYGTLESHKTSSTPKAIPVAGAACCPCCRAWTPPQRRYRRACRGLTNPMGVRYEAFAKPTPSERDTTSCAGQAAAGAARSMVAPLPRHQPLRERAGCRRHQNCEMFLHISADEPRKRLIARLDAP